jgi:hypothetical protein
MKTIVSALTALSVLGLVAPPASAFDAKFSGFRGPDGAIEQFQG